MADIASLDISVTANGVKQAAADLRSLGRAAADSDGSIQSITGTLSWLKGQNMQAFASNLKVATGALVGSKEAFKDFASAAGNLTKSSTSMSAIATASERLVTNEAGLSGVASAMERIRTALVEMQGTAGVISKLSNVGGASNVTINAGGGGSSKNYSAAASSLNGLTQAQNRALANLEREAYLVNHSKAEWLAYKAAQLGITQQAASYISTLQSTTTQTNNLSMSQKGLNAAMRNVPAQFTDIIVSLQGGQAPMTVLLQQGGQLKDMFGGVGNAAKALAEYIAKLVTPFTVAGAAMVGIGYAWYKGAQEAEVFNKALNKTGGYLGITTDQFTTMSKAIGNSTSQGAEALTALASSGKFTGENIQQLAQTTLEWSRITGDSVSKVVQQFEEIQESPTKAIVKLNEQYHFLTASTYAQIAALEAQGNATEAVRIAQEALVKASSDTSRKMQEDLGLLQKGWRNLTGWATTVKDALMDLGRDKTQREKLHEVNEELIKIYKGYEKLKNGSADQQRLAEDVLKEVNALRQKRELLMGNISSAEKEVQAKAESAKKEQEIIQRLEKYNQLAGGVLTKEQAIKKATEETNELVAKGLMTRAAADNAVMSITKQFDKYKDTAADTEKKRVVDKLNSLSVEKQGLEANLGVIKDQIAVLKGEKSVDESRNQYSKQIAEYEQKIKNEKDASVRASMQNTLSTLKELEAAEQVKDSLTKQNAEKEKMLKQADALRKSIGSEYDKLVTNHQIKLDQITTNTELSKEEKAKLTTLENQTFELEKQKKLATSPVQKLTAEYNINIASVDREFDPVTQHEANEKRKTELTRTYKKQREQLLTEESKKESKLFEGVSAAIESMGASISSNLTAMLIHGKSARDVMNSLGETILNSVVQSVVKAGVEESILFARRIAQNTIIMASDDAKTANKVTGDQLANASTLSMLGTELSAAASYMAAWIAASWARLVAANAMFGPFAPAAAAAEIAAGLVLIKNIASNAMHDNGGYIGAGETGIVGEYGPEIVTGPAHVTSRRETAKALGGESSTTNVTVVNQTGVAANASVSRDSSGEMVVTLTEMLPDIMAQQASNPHSKFNKAYSGTYQTRRRR